MSSLLKQKLMLIFILAALLITFFGFLIANDSLAWFSENREVTANGLTVSADYDGTIKSVKYYRVTDILIDIDENDVKHNIYSFSYDESVLATQTVIGAGGSAVPERDSFNTAIKMLPYSDLSGDCQILIEVELDSNEPVTLSVETLTEEYLGNALREHIANDRYDFQPNGLPLSSVLRFAVFSSVGVDEKNRSYTVGEDDAVLIERTFVNVSTGAGGALTYEFRNPLQNGVSVTPQNGSIYIFADYYLPAVEDINEQVIRYVDEAESAVPGYNAVTLGETNLVFKADFEFKVTRGAQ